MEMEGNAGNNIHSNQTVVNYMNKKGIHELFEAIMTALMIHKPDDHISFIRECLDKVQDDPLHVRWDRFVTSNNNSINALSSTSLLTSRQEPLPPVRAGSETTTTYLSTRNKTTTIKSMPLPPIEPVKTTPAHLPIIFILSKSSSTKLCSRLMERYRQIVYLSINDISDIDDENESGSKKNEHRFDCVQRVFDRYRSQARGFLLAGDLNEQNFINEWKNKLGRIDLMFALLPGDKPTSVQNSCLRSLDLTNDFDDLLADTIRALDELFPQDSFTSERGMPVIIDQNIQKKDPTVPIIFLIDNHQTSRKFHNNNNNNNSEEIDIPIDYEFEILNNEIDDEKNNSFVFTLCQRFAQQFSFQHIAYENMDDQSYEQFDQLKMTIIDSMGACAGYIIDHFPDSFHHLHRFEFEIGPCSALIYIGENHTVTKNDELNSIIEHFKRERKAIYVDCRMEVDEIYEDLKHELLKHL